MVKGDIKIGIDSYVEIPVRNIAQDLARNDSFTQADFFVWFFNALFYRVCGGDKDKFHQQLAFIEGDLDHITKRRLKEWVDGFSPEPPTQEKQNG